MKKRLKVLLLFDVGYNAKRGYMYDEEFKEKIWSTEFEIYKALRDDLKHDVSLLGVHNDINILFEEIKDNRPDVVFNVAEVFNNRSHLDKNVVSVLEMIGIPYTGATPTSLMICNNKALTKKILSYHHIRVPGFYTYYREHRIFLPKRLKPPLIIKPLRDEASRGISQSSVVDNEQALIERVKYIHEGMKMDAIAEEYIDGREFYVSVIGNKRIRVLPLRELKFGEFLQDEPRIATYKAKWDLEYRAKYGIKNMFAGRLQDGLDKKIEETSKRAYRVLNMKCYARFDIRVSKDSKVYILEANANPSLEKIDEVVQSADKGGISFPKLVQKIIDLAFIRGQ
jgi:D-alanine-D-alanine ligase